jgi:hypothetical protein
LRLRPFEEKVVRISFDLGGVFYPGAPDEDNAIALQALLEALIAINRVYMRACDGKVPGLYLANVPYARTQIWDSTPDLYARGYGDCKSLTATRIAELREQGEECQPVFRFAQNPQTGARDFHILVRNGADFEDPSRKLGMVEYHRRKGLWVFPE